MSPQHAHRRDAWRELDAVLSPRSEAGSTSGPTAVGAGLGLGRVSGLCVQCLWLESKTKHKSKGSAAQASPRSQEGEAFPSSAA